MATMIPKLPLDALAGYTVTREGPHFYTLTPTERPRTMTPAQIEREDAYEAECAELHSRAEWREQ